MGKILVTGGSGFIGSHLCAELIRLGHDVTVYDLVSPKTSNVRYIQGDIVDYADLVEAVKGHTAVCHLAAVVGVVQCINNPGKVSTVNYEGVKLVARACQAAEVKNLLFTSSSEVYGEGTKFGFLIESMDLNPLSPYGISKMKAERFLKDFCEEANVKTTVIRYCNVYGIGQNNGFVVPIFIENILYNRPLPVYGDGGQIRNFTFVSDAVDGTVKALFRNDNSFDTFNIASPESMTIKDLADQVIRIHGGGAIKFLPFELTCRKREYEVSIRIPSVDKAAEVLKFKAVTTVEAGLRKIYADHKGSRQLPGGKISQKIDSNYEANTHNWKIGWGYTSICNMKCPFCYSNNYRQGHSGDDLEASIRFIDNNAQFIDSINFGTGECSLSDNWFRLISYIRNHYPSICQAVTTNGSLAFRAKEKEFDLSDVIDEVDISLDYADPKKHNRIRGNDQAYSWVLETLKFCADRKITATIVFVGFADTLNPKNLEGLFGLAAKYHAFVRMNILRPLKGVKIDPPPFEQLMSSMEWILKYNRVVSLCDPLFGAICNYPDAQREATGISSLRILSDGTITPSTYLITEEWWAANIKLSYRLSEAGSSETFRTVRQAPIPLACDNCTHIKTCRGGAIDRRILHYNSLAERDPYCPKRYGYNLPALHVKSLYTPTAGRKPSVHDGYLPTLIFAPGRE